MEILEAKLKNRAEKLIREKVEKNLDNGFV